MRNVWSVPRPGPQVGLPSVNVFVVMAFQHEFTLNVPRFQIRV
jgi:hypothetical protein